MPGKRGPRSETADQIGGAGQPQPLERHSSEAGRLAIVADTDDLGVRVDLKFLPLAARSEPPFEYRTTNSDTAWNHAFGDLVGRVSVVDDERAPPVGRVDLSGGYSSETRPGLCKHRLKCLHDDTSATALDFRT